MRSGRLEDPLDLRRETGISMGLVRYSTPISRFNEVPRDQREMVGEGWRMFHLVNLRFVREEECHD